MPRAQIENAQALPSGLDSDDYEWDESDALPRAIVGPWVRQKHALLSKYVTISGTGVRKKWLKSGNAGATYIDLFSGPGRICIRDTAEILGGSPVVAWRQAQACRAPFTKVVVADAHSALVEAVKRRLEVEGAPVESHTSEAAVAVDLVVQNLNPYGLHFAFLDPFNLASLSFDIIRKLAKLERMDILIHVSAQDINRNLRKYVDSASSPLDAFVPGWRDHVDTGRPDNYVRGRIFEHWRSLLKTVDMQTAEAAELVAGTNNQPLYWLAFVARHPRALDFWEKIRGARSDPQMGLL
jgi:three-Cys-motif partner protein